MSNQKYYRIELDDYAAASFTSFSKEYFGDQAAVQEWIDAIAADEKRAESRKELRNTFEAFKAGEKNLSISAAYRTVPFMTPMTVLKKERLVRENVQWEHINTWGFPYNIRCKVVESEHIWLSCGRKHYRGLFAKFINPEYESARSEWQLLGDMLWGFPEVLTLQGNILQNRLAEPEKFFGSKYDALSDWEAFCKKPDPIYKEFCNDIFGDG